MNQMFTNQYLDGKNVNPHKRINTKPTMRLFTLIILYVLMYNQSIGQIAQFNFPATNTLVVSTKDANVTVSNMSLSAGTIETSTSSTFPNQPLIEETGGWTTNTQATAKNFQFTITAGSGYIFSVTNVSFRALATTQGPSAFGFAIGATDVFSTNAGNANLVFVSQAVTGQTGLSSTTVKIQGWLNGSRTTAGTGAFRLDDVIISGIVSATNAAPTATVNAITGTLNVGATLTGNYTYADAESNPEGISTYKWYRANDNAGAGEAAIAGATATTYVLTAADQAKFIRFSVVPVATAGTTTGVETFSARVGAINSVPTASAVSISGSPVIGQTLTGAYTYADVNSDAEGTSTYKWYRADDNSGTNEAAISGATSNTYSVGSADLNKYIRFSVIPVAATGSSPGAETFSSRVGPGSSNQVPLATSVSITGTTNIGQTLTGTYTYSDNENDAQGTSTFKWYRANTSGGAGEAAISGATSITYILTPADQGKFIRFGVIPVAATGTSPGAEAFSARAGAINSFPSAGTVAITGTAVVGQTLSSSYTYSDADGDAESTSTYKWYRANDNAGTGEAAISGAMAATYILTTSDIGKFIRCSVIPVATAGSTPGTETFSSRQGPVTTNGASTITADAGLTPGTNVDYANANFQGTDVTAAGYEIARFKVNDVAGTPDDGLPTTLTALSFSLSNSGNVRRVALYNDSNTEIQELASAATLNFSSLNIAAASGNSKSFSVRITFTAAVTDNVQPQLTITSATALATGSSFNGTAAGGAASSTASDDNRIEVTATKLEFTTGAQASASVGSNLSPAPVVTARDAGNNTDLDYTYPGLAVSNTANLTTNGQAPTVTSGVLTFSNFNFTATGTTKLQVAATINAATFTVQSTDIAVTLTNSPVTTWITSGNTTAWLAATNWNNGLPTTTNVAQFDAQSGNSTTYGITFITNLSFLGIDVTANRPRVVTINGTGGGSSASWDVTLTGAVINNIPNTILRNSSAFLFTMQPGSANNKLTNVVLGNSTENIVNAEGAGGIAISSNITGAGRALTKAGTGTLTLTGANTYSGATTVSGAGTGTLALLGTISSIAYTANITSSAQSVTFGSTPTLGTYKILPGSLVVGTQNMTINGLNGVRSASFNFSNSTVTVTNVVTTTTVSALSAVTYGNTTPVNLVATVSPNPGAGIAVTFKDGTTILGSANTSSSGIATFAYTPTSALNAGTHTINADFAGGGNFAASTGAASWVVNARSLNFTGSKTYDGTATFTTGQLAAGNMAYSEAAPTITGSATVSSANVGSYTAFSTNSLSTTNTNYSVSGGTVAVTINQALPSVTTPPIASDITAGQSLASSTLSGGAGSVPGSFAFTTPSTTPPIGTNSQPVTFTPTDNVNYTTASTSASVTVIGLSESTAAFRSNGPVNFTTNSNWQYFNGSTYAGASSAPGTGNSVEIRHAATLDTDFPIGAGKAFTITAGSLSISPTATLSKADNSGSVNFGGFPVTVQSAPAGTGSIGTMGVTVAGANNVTVERYLPQNTYRAWRLLSVPTKASGQTIKQAWMENQAPLVVPAAPFAQYGTLISTGSSSNMVNGFDAVTQAGSIRGYNGSAFASLTSVNTAIETTGGYFLFVRGNRSTSVNVNGGVSPYANPTATTLRTNGTIYQGDVTVTLPPTVTFGLVGNLYAAEINFASIIKTNVDDKMYVWDAKLNTGGGYRTFLNIGGGTYTVSGGVDAVNFPSVTTSTPAIPSGHAFFVVRTAPGASSVTLSEGSKTNGHVNAASRPGQVSAGTFSTLLYDAAGKITMDGNVLIFGSRYSNAVDAADAIKLYNPSENISILKNGKALSIETRTLPAAQDEIYFELTNLKQQQYSLGFAATNLPAGIQAFLADGYLGTLTAIDLSAKAMIPFTINSDTKSAATNRFKVVFRPSAQVVNNGKTFIRVSPNPVEGSQLKLQFSNQPQGSYKLNLVDVAGRIVYAGYAQHAGGTVVQSLSLPSVTRGTYQLVITAPDNTKRTEKVLINKNN